VSVFVADMFVCGWPAVGSGEKHCLSVCRGGDGRGRGQTGVPQHVGMLSGTHHRTVWKSMML